MADLLRLEWGRDEDGYRIEYREPKEDDFDEGDMPGEKIAYFEPIGRRTQIYDPLRENPTMFMEFARSVGAASLGDPSLESIKLFVNKYGLLQHPNKPARIGDFIYESLHMESAISIWEKGLENNDLTPLIRAFNTNQRELVPVNVMFGRAWDVSHPSLFIVPRDLLSGMWLQFAQAVSTMTKLKKCNFCSTWFAHGTGTGRRKTADYCSGRCRRAAYRHRKEIGK